MPYEVQQNTADGWVSLWLYDGSDGVTRPETFATAEEAAAALDDYLDDYLFDIGENFSRPYATRDLGDLFRVRYVPKSASERDPR